MNLSEKLNKVNILLVDNDELIRDSLSLFFQCEGGRFLAVDSAEKGLEALKDAKYDVIDGQHRIEALRYAREAFGLQTYDLIMFVYSEEGKREIYRRLNLGSPLTLAQHLKAIDNGRVKFFSSMRQYCDHHTKGSKVKFSSAISLMVSSASILEKA